MPQENLEEGKQMDIDTSELPADLQDKLQEGSAPIFMAAFKSAKENGMDEESAKQVAWNTVKHDYDQREDGTWRRRAQHENVHNKAVQSGGN